MFRAIPVFPSSQRAWAPRRLPGALGTPKLVFHHSATVPRMWQALQGSRKPSHSTRLPL